VKKRVTKKKGVEAVREKALELEKKTLREKARCYLGSFREKGRSRGRREEGGQVFGAVRGGGEKTKKKRKERLPGGGRGKGDIRPGDLRAWAKKEAGICLAKEVLGAAERPLLEARKIKRRLGSTRKVSTSCRKTQENKSSGSNQSSLPD